jgi:hypothetical protein
MNFGKNPSKGIANQTPTYHLAPNFTTRPFPNGPYELGTVLEDLKIFWPINKGSDRVPISKDERYSNQIEGVKASLKKNKSGELGILAKVFDRSIGGDASLKGQKHDEDVYTIQKLETVNFFPGKAYISKCLKLADVNDTLEGSNYEEPVYLITGLKIAWGATVTMTRGQNFDASGRIGAQAPAGTVDLALEAKAKAASDSTLTTSHTKPADFILGIQVIKIWHKKKLLSSKRSMQDKLETKGATLVDDDGPKETEENDAEDDFVIGEVEQSDLQDGFGKAEPEVDGNDGDVWYIPSVTY